jgi:hypothetical protein
MVEAIANQVPDIVFVALAGPILFLRSPRWRRLAAFVPTIVLWVLVTPVGSTSWGSRQQFPGEGINSGSLAVGYIWAGVLALIFGVLGLIVAAVIRAVRRRRRGRSRGDVAVQT